MQLAGALMVVLPMEHAHQLAGALDGVAGCWCSIVVSLIAWHVASWRSPLLTALRCCQLVLLFVVGCAAHVAGWCS